MAATEILKKYLKKLGLKDYTDLNTEERETYRKWELALMGRKLTDDDVAAFFKVEMADVLGKLPSAKLNTANDTMLKVKLQFLQRVQTFLATPDRDRAMVEQGIERMIEAS